jgi:hypothetical protein
MPAHGDTLKLLRLLLGVISDQAAGSLAACCVDPVA